MLIAETATLPKRGLYAQRIVNIKFNLHNFCMIFYNSTCYAAPYWRDAPLPELNEPARLTAARPVSPRPGG